MKLEKKVTNNSISNQVYQLLKEHIINLTIKPGTAISEKEIAEKLEVSRTPVREAFVRLVQDDLLEIFPQKGTQVTLIDLKQVEDARFIREHLEKATLKIACQRIKKNQLLELKKIVSQQIESIKKNQFDKFFQLDESFHQLIVNISENEKVWQAIQREDAHLKRIRVLSLFNEMKSKNIIEEHQKIIEALEQRDDVQALQILEKHVSQLAIEGEILKEEFPTYFTQ